MRWRKVRSYLPLKIALLLVFLIGGFKLLIRELGVSLFYNTSSSARVGFYAVIETHDVKRDELVVIELPGAVEGFVSEVPWLRDVPLLKKVGGVAGDSYRVKKKEFFINGELVGPIFKYDRLGRALPGL